MFSCYDRLQQATMKQKRVLFALILILSASGCSQSPPTRTVPPTGTPATESTSTTTSESTTATATHAVTAAPTQTGTATSSPAVLIAPTATGSFAALEGTPAAIPEPTPDETLQRAFDEFLEQAFFAQITRDPELISELGLAQAFGMDNSQLIDMSSAYQLETYALLEEQLESLHNFDRTALTPEQQLSYDLFEWDLKERLRGKEFRFHDYPVNQLFGVQNVFIEFMTDRHPLANLQNAHDYVSRLEGFSQKIDQTVEWLQIQEAEGITPPRFLIQRVLGQLQWYTSQAAERTELYREFMAKVSGLDGISEEQKGQLYQDAASAIAHEVIPAYQKLQTYFLHLEEIADTEDGFWKHPDGEAAYNYWLHHHTTTELTADEIHELGLAEVARIQAEMEVHFSELGIIGDSLADKMNQLAVQSGFVDREAVTREYQALIDKTERFLTDLFDIRPEVGVTVVSVEAASAADAYYVSPALDGSRPGTFYVNLARDVFPRFNMPTLAIHEAIPGHHFQIAIQQRLTDIPTFRTGTHFNAYTEGWALYAEQLAWEAGFYDDDPYGNLGRLQAELFRAARLVVDTGIHAKRWSREEAIEYMLQNVGYPRSMVTAEVERYIAWPGQATSYKIGMLKILELREHAMEALGEDFNIKEFHNIILTNGAMPMVILERVVDDYVDAKLNASPGN